MKFFVAIINSRSSSWADESFFHQLRWRASLPGVGQAAALSPSWPRRRPGWSCWSRCWLAQSHLHHPRGDFGGEHLEKRANALVWVESMLEHWTCSEDELHQLNIDKDCITKQQQNTHNEQLRVEAGGALHLNDGMATPPPLNQLGNVPLVHFCTHIKFTVMNYIASWFVLHDLDV